MPRRLLCLLVAALLAACGGEQVPRPHVVHIVIDTLRADVMYGGGYTAERPNITALAQDGVVFPHAFTHAPLTLPSHTSLFSSRTPAETGVLANGQTVPDDLPLLAEWLSQRGYETRAVVSMGTLLSQGEGLKRGFDVFDADFVGMADASNTAGRLRTKLDGWDGEEPLFLFAHYSDPHAPYRAHGTDGTVARVAIDGQELTQIVTADGIAWDGNLHLEPGTHEITLDSDERFRVLSLRIKGVEGKLEPTWVEGNRLARQKKARATFEVTEAGPVETVLWVTDVVNTKTKRERYLLEAQYADRYVGELIAGLKERGIYDDCLIVLHSDHGESLGENDYIGHAQALTDVTLHVPLVVKPPKRHPLAGALARQAKKLVSLVDIAPTILAFCAAPSLPGQRGTALTDDGTAPYHVAQTHKPDAKQDMVCFRDMRFKMVLFSEEDRFEMYDLEADPLETVDVYAEHAAERPEWPDRLRAVAAASEVSRREGSTDAATQDMLEALGYAGGEE